MLYRENNYNIEYYDTLDESTSEMDEICEYCIDEAVYGNEYPLILLVESGEDIPEELLNEGLGYIYKGITRYGEDDGSPTWRNSPLRKMREIRQDRIYNARYENSVNNTSDRIKRTGKRLASIASAPFEFLHRIDKYRLAPRNVIAQKIASLRNLYRKFLKRSQRYIDDERASYARRAAFYILKAIDKLLKWAQRKANDYSR